MPRMRTDATTARQPVQVEVLGCQHCGITSAHLKVQLGEVIVGR